MEYHEAVKEFSEYFQTEAYESVAESIKNDEDIHVNCKELELFSPQLFHYIQSDPENAMNAGEEALQSVDIVNDDIDIKLKQFPDEDFIQIKNLRAEHIGNLVALEGVVTDTDGLQAAMVSGIFECSHCGDRYKKEQEVDEKNPEPPIKCDCGSRDFELVERNLVDYQKFELTGDKSIKCEVIDGVIGHRGGVIEKFVTVYGVYKVDADNLPFVEVNNVEFKEKKPSEVIEEDLEKINVDPENLEDPKDIEEFIGSLNRDKFEDLLAEIFRKAGWHAEVTQKSGDQGIDVEARKRFPVHRKYLIQAKYNSEGNKLNADHVRNYNSLKEQEVGVDQVILATTSSFTSQAEYLGDKLDIELWDRNDILVRLAQLGSIEEESVLEVTEGQLKKEQEQDKEGYFDSGVMESEIKSDNRENLLTIKSLIKQEEQEEKPFVKISKIVKKAEKEGIKPETTEEIIKRLKREGELFERKQNHIEII